MYDMLIIGAGPAGLAAGIYSGLFGLRTLILESNKNAGGRALKARNICNYPGFVQRISGKELIKSMICQAEEAGVRIHTSEKVVRLLFKKRKIVETENNVYSSKAVILAAGAGMKGLGLREETWIGEGITYCAECSDYFLRGMDVIVIGSTKQAVEEALRLTRIAANVRLVNHANTFVVEEHVKSKLKEDNVQLIESYVGVAIEGVPPIKELVLQSLKGSSIMRLKANIIFVVSPVDSFVSVLRNAGIVTHRQGCVDTDVFGRTNINGVFAAGSCTSMMKDIIPSCVGDGTTVAAGACLYVKCKT